MESWVMDGLLLRGISGSVQAIGLGSVKSDTSSRYLGLLHLKYTLVAL